ncbi:hypothetical protein [Caldanaerobius polysaccharolyticus]|uniref:hypothetical protein n=1 Tax=Caldanaerobius polysaccharolyticus TaxID=44256 RepID=UPI00047EBDD0|nr:hypothetical protein [Caldanaerobius polysaccharolyticus]
MAASVLLNNVMANGPGLALDCTNKKRALLRITGKFHADVVFEASLDGVDYFSYSGRANGAGSRVAVVSAPGYVVFEVEPIVYLRPKVSRYESGAITVVGYAE